MDQYENIATAAHQHDWQGCAHLMFLMLACLTKEKQKNVANETLNTYAPIWKSKHNGPFGELPACFLSIGSWVTRLVFPDIPEDVDLDPADAEFENGLIEFCNGVSTKVRRRHLAHFATAIRSAVTARQIQKWMESCPKEYAQWKSGRSLVDVTFFDDEAASGEAVVAWTFVESLLKENLTFGYSLFSRQSRHVEEIETLYRKWEEIAL